VVLGIRQSMKCIQLNPHERLGALAKDAHAKKDVAYMLEDRSHEWAVLAQSLPLLAQFVNECVSNGERCERLSVTGLFENLNRRDGASGGWVKGRYRVTSVSRNAAVAEFEAIRHVHNHAAIVGHRIRAVQTSQQA